VRSGILNSDANAAIAADTISIEVVLTREAASSSRYRAVVDENGIVAHDIDAHAAATAAAGEVGVSTRATRAAVDCSAIAERAAVAQQSKPVTTRATTA